jgi:hypothetical protein
MKKLTLILLVFITGSLMLFTGCQDPEPTEVKPTISFESGADYISADATLEASAEFMIGINADANENSGAMLTKLEMVRHFVNLQTDQTVTWDTVINVSTYSIDFLVTAFPLEGNETFIFTITDAEGETAEVSLDITTEITYGPLSVFENVTLGDQDNSTGSSFASLDGTVYNLADAKENSDKIDFVYYYGATNKATLCAPADETAAQVYNNATYGVATWATRNATVFKETEVTVEEFDAIPADNDTQVIEFATGADQSKITNLDHDGAPVVLAFETVAGKKGLIKIEDLLVGDGLTTPGHITITVKVQE